MDALALALTPRRYFLLAFRRPKSRSRCQDTFEPVLRRDRTARRGDEQRSLRADSHCERWCSLVSTVSSLWCEVLGVDDEILTIRELAALPKIGEKTAHTMAQSGDFPEAGASSDAGWRAR